MLSVAQMRANNSSNSNRKRHRKITEPSLEPKENGESQVKSNMVKSRMRWIAKKKRLEFLVQIVNDKNLTWQDMDVSKEVLELTVSEDDLSDDELRRRPAPQLTDWDGTNIAIGSDDDDVSENSSDDDDGSDQDNDSEEDNNLEKESQQHSAQNGGFEEDLSSGENGDHKDISSDEDVSSDEGDNDCGGVGEDVEDVTDEEVNTYGGSDDDNSEENRLSD